MPPLTEYEIDALDRKNEIGGGVDQNDVRRLIDNLRDARRDRAAYRAPGVEEAVCHGARAMQQEEVRS